MADWDFCSDCNAGNNCSTHFPNIHQITLSNFSDNDIKLEYEKRQNKIILDQISILELKLTELRKLLK